MSQVGLVISLTALLICLAVPNLRGWAAPLTLVSAPCWLQAAYLEHAFPPIAVLTSPLGFLLTCGAAAAVTGTVSHLSRRYTLTLQRTPH